MLFRSYHSMPTATLGTLSNYRPDGPHGSTRAVDPLDRILMSHPFLLGRTTHHLAAMIAAALRAPSDAATKVAVKTG